MVPFSHTTLQKAVKAVAQAVQIHKPVGCHTTLRHSFATTLLEQGYEIRTIEELLGHKSTEPTLIYTRAVNHSGFAIRSPVDIL